MFHKADIFWRVIILCVVLATPRLSMAQDTVNMRYADHQNFSRIVFDWPDRVTYHAQIKDDKLEIIFDKPNVPNWHDLPNDPLNNMKAPTYQIEGGKLIVTFTVKRGAELKDFRSGTKIGFDVLAGNEALSSPADKIRPAGKQSADHAVIQETLPKDIMPKNINHDNINKNPNPPLQHAPKEASITPAGDLKLSVNRTWDNMELSYPWGDNTNAAVFIRDNILWVVFDEKRKIDQTDLDRFIGQRILSARQLDHPYMTVLMYEIVPDQHVKARKTGATWKIDLKKLVTPPFIPILSSTQRSKKNKGENYFYAVEDTGEVLFIEDPIIGDDMAIIPVHGSSQGVLQSQKFVEFESLATAQGIAVSLIGDNISIVKYRNGISVTSKDGLALSQSALSNKLDIMDGAGEDAGDEGHLIDFAQWKKGPVEGGDYYANKHELLYRLSNSTDSSRSVARWNLAKFYLANGRYRESFGIMNVMLDDYPKLRENPEFRATLAVTNVLMHRYKEASHLLDHKSFISAQDMYLWKAVVNNKLGKYKEAFEDYKKGADVLLSQAPKDQIRFLFAAINAAHELGDRDFVEFSLSLLKKLPLNAEQLTEVDYWRAVLERDAGNLPAAEDILQHVAKAGIRETAARAKFDLINMDLKDKKIDSAEAVDRLEKLRFAWRGDDFELDLLSKLADLYVQQKEFNLGLQTLKLAVTFFEGSKKTDVLTRQMGKIYSDLFLHGGANVMDPVKAVALYSEFRELIPLGKEGDDMTRRLADRLVSLDLLKEAASLLDHQIKFRLKGGAQAVVASRLAMIYLLDSRPNDALGILRATRDSQTPDDIENRRTMIEARALIQLGRYEEADVLIGSYNTPEAEDLRSDIYWKSSNWKKYISHSNKLLNGRYKNEAELTSKERLAILRLSAAYVINQDKAGVKKLRDHYKADMDKGLYGDIFDVITAERQRSDMNVRRLTKSIASISKLESFMESYKAEFTHNDLPN